MKTILVVGAPNTGSLRNLIDKTRSMNGNECHVITIQETPAPQLTAEDWARLVPIKNPNLNLKNSLDKWIKKQRNNHYKSKLKHAL